MLQSLEAELREVDGGQLEGFVKALMDAFYAGKGVFIYGAGRSLLVGKAFSMRLMHLGFKSYVVGETVTPAVGAGDIFLVVSKTLSHEPLSVAVDEAKRFRARIAVITSGDGHVLEKADSLVVIPDLKSAVVEASETCLPMGTLFEISAMVLLDCVVAELMSRLNVTEEDVEKRHANIQ